MSGATALLLSEFAIITPALAKERPVVVVADADIITRNVNYSDLNLASASGERTLHRRVTGAIRGLCVEAVGGDNGYFVNDITRIKCEKTAWSQARPQMARLAQRARDIAATGNSPIAAGPIKVVLPK